MTSPVSMISIGTSIVKPALSEADAAIIRSRLEETETAFPFPGGEMRHLKSREWVLSDVEKGGIAAEIGAFRGHFSEVICRIAEPRELYLIDPWISTG